MKDIWKKLNIKGHLLTAISYLIPIVCGAGFLVAIGMAFGGRDHSTVMHACEKVASLREQDPIFNEDYKNLLRLLQS